MNINFIRSWLMPVAGLLLLAGCGAASARQSVAQPLGGATPAQARAAIARIDAQIAALRATLPNMSIAADARAVQAQAAGAATKQARAEVLFAGSSRVYARAMRAQEEREASAFTAAIQMRTSQAYDHRAQRLAEQESTLQLDLQAADQTRILPLEAKLRTLVLRPQQRSTYRAQLAAIRAHEDAALAARRTHDARVLQSFQARLLAKAQADLSSMTAQLQARTRANIAQYQRIRKTLSSPAPRVAGGGDSPYRNAGSRIGAEFTALAHGDAAARAATQAAIAQLQGERESLLRWRR